MLDLAFGEVEKFDEDRRQRMEGRLSRPSQC